MKPTLCHVVFDEYPQDSRVRRYTNALVAAGWEVFVICSTDSLKRRIETDACLTVYRIPITKRRSTFLRRIWEYAFFCTCSFFLASYLSVFKQVRVFHVHTLPDFLVFSCSFAKAAGAKLILDFHELFPEFMRQHVPSLQERSLITRMLVFQERVSLNFADEVIAFHDPAKEILDKRANRGKTITVIMNGVDPNELPVINRAQGGAFRIVYNGTINYNLNLPMVVKALSELKRTSCPLYDTIEFHLYGKGPDLPNILDLAKEHGLPNVFYHGQLEFRKMMEELSSASLCILPPKRDIYSELYYSLKLTEMIFLRIPVIATRLSTYLRYYPENCITYFNSEDLPDLVEKLIYVYEHRDEVAQKAENALLQYQEYSWPMMQKRYSDLLNRVIRKKYG